MNDNDRTALEIKELATRTAAAFMLFDLLARVLDERGILPREELADEILAIVTTRKAELRKVRETGGPELPTFHDMLAVLEAFAKSDMRQP